MRYLGLAAVLLIIAGCQTTKIETAPPTEKPPPTENPPATVGALPSGITPGVPIRPFAEGIVVSTSQLALNSGLTATTFDFYKIRELFVRVKLPGMSQLATLKLEFVDPSGVSFYELSQLYSANPEVTAGTMMGAPNVPSSAFLVKTLPGGYALDYPVAIAGSVFQRSARPGTWTIKASVDGRSLFSVPIDVAFGG